MSLLLLTVKKCFQCPENKRLFNTSVIPIQRFTHSLGIDGTKYSFALSKNKLVCAVHI